MLKVVATLNIDIKKNKNSLLVNIIITMIVEEKLIKYLYNSLLIIYLIEEEVKGYHKKQRQKKGTRPGAKRMAKKASNSKW